MTILILAEHDGAVLNPSIHNILLAASALEQDIHILLVGHGVENLAKQAAELSGVKAVKCYDDAQLSWAGAEVMRQLVPHFVKTVGYSYVLAPSSNWGREVLPGIAVRLDCSMITDVAQIKGADQFVRFIYAGNALMELTCQADYKIMTVRTASFPVATMTASQTACVVENLSMPDSFVIKTRCIAQQKTQSERPSLESARIVVSGGRGVGSREDFAVIEQLADCLGAALGASRAAVDAGFIANDHQVGQTGKVVAPALYIAVGISGAIQHLAGIKDSQVIVAINKDPEAPIFKHADYGLVADLFEAVPELITRLQPDQ